jgi:hypothetical protein
MAELERSRQKTLPARADASFPQVRNSVDTYCNIPLGRGLVHRKFKMLCLGISTIHHTVAFERHGIDYPEDQMVRRGGKKY